MPDRLYIATLKDRISLEKPVKKIQFLSKLEKKEQSKSCPSCMGYSYLTWYISLPNIIKYLKQYESYGLHKISVSGEVST